MKPRIHQIQKSQNHITIQSKISYSFFNILYHHKSKFLKGRYGKISKFSQFLATNNYLSLIGVANSQCGSRAKLQGWAHNWAPSWAPSWVYGWAHGWAQGDFQCLKSLVTLKPFYFETKSRTQLSAIHFRALSYWKIYICNTKLLRF